MTTRFPLAPPNATLSKEVSWVAAQVLCGAKMGDLVKCSGKLVDALLCSATRLNQLRPNGLCALYIMAE